MSERQLSFDQQNLGNSEITELAISSLKQSVNQIKGQIQESRGREHRDREFREHLQKDIKENASIKSSLDGIVTILGLGLILD